MLRSLLVISAVTFAFGTLTAQAPDSMSFQGVLNDGGGTVPDGSYDLLFKMYQGGSLASDQTSLNVPVADGLFSVILAGFDSVAFDGAVELGITINGGSELLPRTPVLSVPFAFSTRGLRATRLRDSSWHVYNMIGGGPANKVADGVRGATIAGGGGWWAHGDRANSVLDNWSTIGGGYDNEADGIGSTISGGVKNSTSPSSYQTISGGWSNTTTGQFATVGGGTTNKATAGSSTVAGGEENTASATESTVGGGFRNDASDQFSTVAGGGFNEASGEASTVPGGRSNRAYKGYTFAAGYAAIANHSGSFVWSDSASAATESTGDNQFIIEAIGGVGVGTNAPAAQLHVVDTLSANGSFLESYVTVVENASAGPSADGLAIKVGTTGNPSPGVNYIGFFDGDDGLIAAIDGNDAGGVTYKTAGTDYAEYMKRREPVDDIAPGDLVGVFEHGVSRETEGALRIMVVTDRPSVLGNMPRNEEYDTLEPIAFVGQVPVNVTGPVAYGDYIVPSGLGNGTGVAVSPDALSIDDLGRLAGRAWSSDLQTGTRKITVEVGLDNPDAVSAVLTRLASRIESHQREIEELRRLMVAAPAQ